MNRLILPLGVVSLLVIGCPENKSQPPHDDRTKPVMTKDTAGTATMTSTTSASVDMHPAAKAVAVKVGVSYEPSKIPAKKGQPLALEFTRTTDDTCAKEVIFDGGPLKGTQVDLPLNKPVRVSFTPDADGDIVFGCHMSRMIAGKIHVSS